MAGNALALDKDTGNTTTIARTSDGRPVDSEKVAKEVAAFWTPERMAAAVDLDLPKSTDTNGSTSRAPKPSGPAGSIPPALPAIANSDGGSIQLNESQTVGKVYFTLPNGQ